MSMDKPFRIEVVVDAPRDEVWREMTEVDRIKHWFGWEYDGLDEEIEFIFVKHTVLRPPDRIDFTVDGGFELEELDGDRTLIRVTKPGDAMSAEWKDVYGGIEEGWTTFLNQLRHKLVYAPRGTRRMVVLNGTLSSLPDLPGTPWHASRWQRGADVQGSLVVVGYQPSGEAMLLVNTYDLDDEAFAAISDHWSSWWAEVSGE